jgi:predicted alpha/beta hydrolase
VSPYLNLARRDINPAINYYGLVRPQFELRNTLQQFGNQITGLEQQQAALGNEFTADLPVTGQRAGFQTQNRYFFNTGVGVTGLFGQQRGLRPGSSGAGGVAGTGGFSGVGAGTPAPPRKR